MNLKFISVCSGIEAASVAWEPLGWQALAFCEVEPFPCAVLAHHWPSVPNLGDLTKWRDWPADLLVQAEVLIGGTPCQSFSVAGLRGGFNDARGNLSQTFVELANAIDDLRRDAGLQPAFILWENVPGVLSDNTNAFGSMLGGLAGSDAALVTAGGASWPDAGVVAGPSRVVAFRCLDAQHFGLAQRRKRVFVLARGGLGNWSAADALLPIGDGVRGDSSEGRTTGQGVAGAPTGGTGSRDIAKPLGAHWSRQDLDNDTYIVGTLDTECGNGKLTTQSAASGHLVVTHSLRGEGFDASEDGTGRGTPLVVVTAFPAHMSTPSWSNDLSQTLQAENPQAVAVMVQSVAMRGRDGGSTPELSAIAPAVRTPGGGSSAAMVLVGVDLQNQALTGDGVGSLRAAGLASGNNGTAVLAFSPQQVTCPNNHSNPKPGDPCHTLPASGHPGAVALHSSIRRLTPRECERLQGFPDDHTAIPYKGRPASDSPRYKAIGNSMAVPCIRWLGQQIERVGLSVD